jgi:hypothetical protein
VKTYRINMDNESTSGIEVDIEVIAADMVDEKAIEATIAEAVRRVMAAVNSTPFDTMSVVKADVRNK